mmetsp:Transcript_3786/g.5688  ORF Transcript_3786/g.5688 Transcript_3786/m.5688 type:complete len:264 (-) Transcript_3786:163-954(-)
MAPIICSSLTTKRSLLGLGWSITSVVSLTAFVTAATLSASAYSYYNRMASSYAEGQYYGQYYEDENQEQQSNDSADDAEVYQALASVGSFSVIFAGLYTMLLAVALSCFGGMCVVGFVSPRGRYFPPMFTGTDTSSATATSSNATSSSSSSRAMDEQNTHTVNPKYLGIFLGLLVLFSNLCLVAAVVLGEFQVGSYLDDRQKEEIGYFAIERAAIFLGTMSMFLAVLYFVYAVLLFTMKDVLIGEENDNKSSSGYTAPTASIA